MNPPDEQELREAEQKLRGKRRGATAALGGGIHLRLTADGSQSFQYRTRDRLGKQLAETFATWKEAHDALEAVTKSGQISDIGDLTVEDLRRLTIDVYAELAWWPQVMLDCDILTQHDYQRGLADLLPHVRTVTLAQLEEKPLLIDRIKAKIAEVKTYADKPGQEPRLHKAAADKPLKILSAICSDAVKRDIFIRNPMAGVKRFNRRRTASGGSRAASHRPILPSEVKHPYIVVQVGTGMRGDPLLLLQRRLLPELIFIGMRPSDILAMRHRWWRDANGPLRFLHVDAAVKNLAGTKIEGEPKTGARDLYLFAAIAERLEQIHELQGSPELGALVYPNAWGGLLDWGNWRNQVWYPALHRAGLADAPRPDARGAFYPYILRHAGVTVMLHADRPQGGTYSEREVARQFGHTVGTLDRVYADIPDDMHGIAGMTMDEIIRTARREIRGPLPGDPDHQPVEYDLLQASALTGIDNKALAARIQRGSLPGSKRQGKYYLTHFDLTWHGLLNRPTPPRR
jgi:hypothetical protein